MKFEFAEGERESGHLNNLNITSDCSEPSSVVVGSDDDVGGGDGGNQIDEICHAFLHPMVLLFRPSGIAEGDLLADSGFVLLTMKASNTNRI